MEKQIQEVISRLPESNVTYDVIFHHATIVTNDEVLTDETIRGVFQTWNDFYNANEGISVSSNAITKRVLKNYIGTLIGMDASYLAQCVEDELADRAK